MNLIQLKYFNTVARLENMSKAAKLLKASQPAISKNIAKLEEELGYSLFERKGKSLTLNEKGTLFLEYSTEAVSLLERACEEIKESSNGSNKIRIGLAADYKKLGPCIAGFLKKHPQAEFELLGNPASSDGLDINELDMMIYPKTNSFSKFNGIHLYQEKSYLAVASSNKEFKETELADLKKLSNKKLVFLKNQRLSEGQMKLLLVLAIEADAIYTDTEELRRMMIMQGIALGIIPEGKSQYYECDEIRLLPIQDKRFSRDIMICFRKEKHLSPLAKEFESFAKEYFKLKD